MTDGGLASSVAVPIWLLVLLGLALLFLAVTVWSLKRHRNPVLRTPPDLSVVEALPALSGLTHGHLIPGNAVEILQNGAFFEVLLARIGHASQSVHFETFLWKDGALGRRLADSLCERARNGVQVRVLVDANGGKDMGETVERQLRAAGCRLTKFHRGRLRKLGRLNERDHRKVVVIDGREAFVGGHCVVDSWLGDAQDREHFRDLSVHLRGPVVQALQATFAENWVEETGELFFGDGVFPHLEPAGDVTAHAARLKPSGAAPAIKILHHAVICLARKRLWIQNPYFLPDPEAIEALGDAVRRGVDVRVMVPSAAASDMPIVQHAAHRNFARLLALGVRIFEYPVTLLHQKVMTVDGVWCAVGSSNFDDRSFEINDEITLGFHSEALSRQLEEIFEQDARHCVELNRREWAARGILHRLQDRALYLLNEQL